MINRPHIEMLLRQHPVSAPARQDLASTSLRLAIQARRVHNAKQLIMGIFVLATALFIGKWLSNDLGYLLQIPVIQSHVLQNRDQLYVQALWESLPKLPLLVTISLGVLWFAWSKFETLLLHRRITGVTQGLTMKAIKLTPRLVALAAILSTLALGTSTYAVTQKVQQHQLEILRQSVNATGRTELQTNLLPGQCSTGNQTNLTNQYEIKKKASITAADAAHIIEAICIEARAANTLRQAFGIAPDNSGIGSSMTDSATIFMVSQVTDITNSQLTLQLPGATPAGASGQTAALAPDLKVFKDGAPSDLSQLKTGDLILPVHRLAHTTQGSGSASPTVLGFVILPSQPEPKWYGPSYRAQLTQIETCEGNPQDRCSFTGSIDFYPSGGGEGNNINPAFKQTNLPTKQIAGTITEIGPAYTKIKTSSGRSFQINFGSNPAADFNRDRAKHYNNDPAAVGDTLLVRYAEAASQHATTISQNQIFNAVLMLEFTSKDKPINQY